MKLHPNTHGITIEFPNGYSVSIQQSASHYCGKNTVETAVIRKDGKFVPPTSWAEDVNGWQGIDDVLETLNHVSNWPRYEGGAK